MLNALLESGTVMPTFIDPTYRARLAAAAQLTGAARYLTYARLDAELGQECRTLDRIRQPIQSRSVLRAAAPRLRARNGLLAAGSRMGPLGSYSNPRSRGV
jgi:hypothetical protein